MSHLQKAWGTAQAALNSFTIADDTYRIGKSPSSEIGTRSCPVGWDSCAGFFDPRIAA
jgi:hypothetical protein